MNTRLGSGIAALVGAWVLWSGGLCLAGEPVFTRYTIHVQMEVSRKGERTFQASYSGWVDPGKDHEIVPPNTKVIYEPAPDAGWGRFSGNKAFRLLVVDPAAAGLRAGEITFEFNAKNMAMTEEEYVRLITSPTPVSLSGLSRKDAEGVRSGKVSAGMSKGGVMAAYGYPAAHRTPHPESDRVWTYWLNRFKTVEVFFDAKGTVQRVSY